MSVLPVADLRPAASPAQKPSLTALPKVRRRQRGLIAGVLLLLLAALGAVLAVNIHVANSQYQVVQLTNEHRDLVYQNQALTQQVQFLESPQALSNSAVSIGMAMPASAGTLDLSTGEILSQAQEASSSNVPSNFVTAPSFTGPDSSAADVAAEAEGAPNGLLGAGALHTLTQATAGENDSGAADSAPGAGSELNGGTIPAPELTD